MPDAGGQTDLQKRLKELLPSDNDKLRHSERRRASATAGFQFEMFVSELLRLHLRSRDLPSETSVVTSELGHYDLITDTSIRDLPPPIAFSVKFFRNSSHLNQMAKSVWRDLLRGDDSKARSIVLVTNLQPSARAQQVFDQIRSPGSGERLRLVWWGPKDLEALVSQLGDAGSEIVNTLHVADLGAAIRNAIRGDVDLWKANRERYVSELHDSWKADELVFFLGAGVSIDAGVPSWKRLLSELYGALLEEASPDLYSLSSESRAQAVQLLLKLQDNSPLLSARTLRSGLRGRFEDSVRKVIYKKASVEDSQQLLSIARLCDPPRGRIGARAVVTYNFDDLLEQCLSKLNIRYFSVNSGSVRANSMELPIYHVHGLIPQRGALDEDQVLVFSEEGYHTAYNNPYTWSNVVQLNLMTQHTCVFVGLSMTDPNLRRLLEIASDAQSDAGPRHVALLRRLADKDLGDDEEMSSKVAEGISATYHLAWERTLGELGVRILWFEDFSEIPGILKGIRTGFLED